METFKILAICILLSLRSLGQTTIQFIVKNADNHKIDKVDAYDLSQKEFIELSYKDTLNFNFKKNNIDCYNIRYHEEGKIYMQQVWLDKGQIKIEAHLDSSKLVIDTVFNSPKYYEYMNLKRDYPKLYKARDTTAINKMLLEGYTNNIDNPLSLVFGSTYIMINQNSRNDLYKLKQLSDKQGDSFKWFALYPVVIGRLNSILMINSIDLNEYTFTDRKNENVKIPRTNKSFYILDFWFLGCVPCRKDHEVIVKELKRLEDKNAELISISIDEDLKKWNTYLSSHKYIWRNYLDNKAKSITKKLSVQSYPTYIILNKTGDILSTQNSFTAVMDWLSKK